MPLERGGKVYLNQDEAISEEFLDISYGTFKKTIEKDYGLEAKTFAGKSRQRFFLKEVIELIRNFPIEDREEVKKKIQELQSEK